MTPVLIHAHNAFKRTKNMNCHMVIVFFYCSKIIDAFLHFFLNRRENKFIHINLSIFIKLIKPNKNSKTVKSDYAFISLTDSLIYNKKGHRINYLMIFQTRIQKIDSI